MDLSLPIFELVFQHRLLPFLQDRQCRYNIMILDCKQSIVIHENLGKARIAAYQQGF